MIFKTNDYQQVTVAVIRKMISTLIRKLAFLLQVKAGDMHAQCELFLIVEMVKGK